jgi:hypothetical protein
LPVHRSRAAITCLSRHRSCTATPARVCLSSAPCFGPDRCPVSPVDGGNLVDFAACPGRCDYARYALPNSIRLQLSQLGTTLICWHAAAGHPGRSGRVSTGAALARGLSRVQDDTGEGNER